MYSSETATKTKENQQKREKLQKLQTWVEMNLNASGRILPRLGQDEASADKMMSAFVPLYRTMQKE